MVTDQYAMTPRQAIAMIEATGVEDPAKLIRDHAAAGLIRSYAQLQVTIAADGGRHEVRGGKVQPATWERIIAAGADADVWSGGTVRLPGSDLIGGTSAIHVTGVTFHPSDIDRLVDQQRPNMTAKRAAVRKVLMELDQPAEAAATTVRQKPVPDLSALQSGALLLTVNQTKAALAIGRTKVYELINEGTLERPDGGTRITAESARRYAGLIS